MLILSIPLRLAYRLLEKIAVLASGIQIDARAKIGKGLFLVHRGSVVIGPDVVIGDDCTIYHEVTIGPAGFGETPRLGNQVLLSPGAKVLGGVTVGNDAVVGSNSVVVTDVPDHAVVFGVPARVIAYSGNQWAKWFAPPEQRDDLPQNP